MHSGHSKERIDGACLSMKERMWCSIYTPRWSTSYLPASAGVGLLFHYRALRALTLTRYVRYTCRGGLACACQEVGKHVVLPLTLSRWAFSNKWKRRNVVE